MSKMVRAANIMVSNAVKISNVIQKGNEYFFLYGEKYKWSIMFDADENSYSLFYYPGKFSLNLLASMPDDEWRHYDKYIVYNSKELKTREAHDTFNELYRTVKEQLLGIGDVLDDIIKDDINF